MTKEEEMRVCIYQNKQICNAINAILFTPKQNCSHDDHDDVISYVQGDTPS